MHLVLGAINGDIVFWRFYLHGLPVFGGRLAFEGGPQIDHFCKTQKCVDMVLKQVTCLLSMSSDIKRERERESLLY